MQLSARRETGPSHPVRQVRTRFEGMPTSPEAGRPTPMTMGALFGLFRFAVEVVHPSSDKRCSTPENAACKQYPSEDVVVIHPRIYRSPMSEMSAAKPRYIACLFVAIEAETILAFHFLVVTLGSLGHGDNSLCRSGQYLLIFAHVSRMSDRNRRTSSLLITLARRMRIWARCLAAPAGQSLALSPPVLQSGD